MNVKREYFILYIGISPKLLIFHIKSRLFQPFQRKSRLWTEKQSLWWKRERMRHFYVKLKGIQSHRFNGSLRTWKLISVGFVASTCIYISVSLGWIHVSSFFLLDADKYPNKYKKLGDGMMVSKVHQNDSGEYTCKAYQISEELTNFQDRNIFLKIERKYSYFIYCF